MSSEYPTLKISVPLEQTTETINKITRDFSGELVKEENEFKLKVKYDHVLNEEQLDVKLTLLASGRYKSKGFMLVWLAGFFTILSILALVSAKFRADDASKNEQYYKSLSAKIVQIEKSENEGKEIIDFKKFQKSGLEEVAKNRASARNTMMISGSLVTLAVILLLLAYRSKVIRKKRIIEIKDEILAETSKNGTNPNLDSKEDICEFRLFETEDGTEFIFKDEEGSALLVYLIGLVMKVTQTEEINTLFNGNEPLEKMINKYKNQEITTISLDKNILLKINFD